MPKEILILGTGCEKCAELAALVENAVDEMGIECEVRKVTNINDIVSYGVMLTPASPMPFMGSLKKKELPFPSSLSTQILPI